MVPSHCFLAAIFTIWALAATNGQSAAVAAQYMLSGQQYQLTSGQHPAGHIVPSHCFLAAIFTSWALAATNGQSAAVAAQYMLSGQQYQLTSGQHPAGHMVPSHCSSVSLSLSPLDRARRAQKARRTFMLSQVSCLNSHVLCVD